MRKRAKRSREIETLPDTTLVVLQLNLLGAKKQIEVSGRLVRYASYRTEKMTTTTMIPLLRGTRQLEITLSVGISIS